MPTIMRVKGYRFFFFSNEGLEPPHVHVEAAGKYAKFWLKPISLARNSGFKAHELNDIDKIIKEHQSAMEEEWHEFFSRS